MQRESFCKLSPTFGPYIDGCTQRPQSFTVNPTSPEPPGTLTAYRLERIKKAPC